MKNSVIRILRPADVACFRCIRLEALQTDPAAFSSSAADLEALEFDDLSRLLAEKRVFVAFDGDDPVGIMGLAFQQSSKKTHRAKIIMVYVRETFRGMGVATALLNAVTDYSRAHEIRQLELSVSAGNPAAYRFYQREGFATAGRIHGGFLHHGKEIDEIILVRRIIH